MPDEYGGMSISDWNSARDTISKHLAVLLQKDPNYRGIFDTLLTHMIADTFMAQQRPDFLSSGAFFIKYTTLFKQGLGINLMSLDSDQGNWSEQ